MIDQVQLQQVDECLWEIPKSARADMRVPAYVYALEELLEDLRKDRTLDQLMNVATLPGIQKAAIVMPDGHEGYGFPIGGVAATDVSRGVISPGGIGYDINCGVRLLTSSTRYADVKGKIGELVHELSRMIPKGVGRGGRLVLSTGQMEEVLAGGAEWAVANGYGLNEDLDHIESRGRLEHADPARVSDHAVKRGHDQLGTIGAGNHFVEVDRVEEIYDDETAEAFGLFQGQLVILIHTGSRGLGHQVATDYLKTFLNAMPSYGLHIPDRELACAPFSSEDGQNYFKAMAAAANYAWCNREVISWEVRQSWEYIMKEAGENLRLLYDVAHNIAKIETHRISGKNHRLVVHRKGATRAFGPGSPEIPDDFSKTGQPVLIPGSMGTHSYVLAGTKESMENSFGSTCHGAGRRMSRTAAKKMVDAPTLKRELLANDIAVEAGSYAGLAEEAPVAYKDIDLVVETVHRARLARKVAKLRPVGVIKG
ncbi:RtcB family protein [Fodinibius sediminis]|uniref:tRNA-splicing ligase RtcB n=1 Tax=Fodinibius sediminis TaxID=1214077 RepID=A0A521BPT4_9BACT|nr:RtcB family protein [Fodinibius sediminis]SMO49119.1 tRNA-splicing ligase RtcB [Fodinibius sediminis]